MNSYDYRLVDRATGKQEGIDRNAAVTWIAKGWREPEEVLQEVEQNAIAQARYDRPAVIRNAWRQLEVSFLGAAREMAKGEA